MARIYVSGHRNPDTDAIAAAIGYAELKARLDGANDYVPVRLGPVNPQTQWVLDRGGAPVPEFLPHIMLRVGDLMRTEFPLVGEEAPIREAGLVMSRTNLDLVPVVDERGALAGVVTERALARRFIRESRQTSTLHDAATRVQAIADLLEGELLAGDAETCLSGRVWVHSMDVRTRSGISEGDAVVIGNRGDAQRLAIELGASLIVLSNGAEPDGDVLELARRRGTALVRSPLDTYVSGRMITLAAPCRAFMERDPLTVDAEYLVTDVADQIKEIHYGSAVVIDAARHPIGLVTRSNLVRPAPRRVILVDHAESGQSVPGIEHAEIVEILDHHHIGSIETRVPVTATFDPVGSTATLVTERFRHNGIQPSRATATALLGAVLSDTVILNSPTTTKRDHRVVEYLERVLALDAAAFGREMFQETSDVSEVAASELVSRDAKRYQTAGGNEICIAQVEVVGDGLLERKDELLEAMRSERDRQDLQLYALMVTDVMEKATELLVAGDASGVARAFDAEADGGLIDLPGVMSRKKQVAPRLLAAL